MRATRGLRFAARASASTAPSSAGWLRRSASRFHSRGSETPSHCLTRTRADASSEEICGTPLEAASSASAAGSQSPTAMTARCGFEAAAASATAHVDQSSAAGIESAGAPAVRCALGRSAWRRASKMASGQRSDTTTGAVSAVPSWAQPPQPSLPLASVTTSSTPGSSRAAKSARGASGTPSLRSMMSMACGSSAERPSCSRLPRARGTTASLRRRPLVAT